MLKVDTTSFANMTRIFKEPIDWGFIPGPAFLETVSGAQAAVDLWLRHTAEDRNVWPERTMMFELQSRLAALPPEPTTSQVQEAVAAIRVVVSFASKRDVTRLCSKVRP